MRDAGVELIEHVEQLAVMGFVEVLRHVPTHWALLRDAQARGCAAGNVALVVLIDYPGFNMKVAAAATAAGVPVLYYITPQVWAWGAGRLAKLAQTVTKAAVILPFEEPLLREHGIDATFVGHPLLDRAGDAADARRRRAHSSGSRDDATGARAVSRAAARRRSSGTSTPFVATARSCERRIPGSRSS